MGACGGGLGAGGGWRGAEAAGAKREPGTRQGRAPGRPRSLFRRPWARCCLRTPHQEWAGRLLPEAPQQPRSWRRTRAERPCRWGPPGRPSWGRRRRRPPWEPQPAREGTRGVGWGPRRGTGPGLQGPPGSAHTLVVVTALRNEVILCQPGPLLFSVYLNFANLQSGFKNVGRTRWNLVLPL